MYEILRNRFLWILMKNIFKKFLIIFRREARDVFEDQGFSKVCENNLTAMECNLLFLLWQNYTLDVINILMVIKTSVHVYRWSIPWLLQCLVIIFSIFTILTLWPFETKTCDLLYSINVQAMYFVAIKISLLHICTTHIHRIFCRSYPYCYINEHYIESLHTNKHKPSIDHIASKKNKNYTQQSSAF